MIVDCVEEGGLVQNDVGSRCEAGDVYSIKG